MTDLATRVRELLHRMRMGNLGTPEAVDAFQDLRSIAFKVAAEYLALAERCERAERALKDCASPFTIGDNRGLVDRETIMREFNRRQVVAATAIGQSLCRDVARATLAGPAS